MLGLRSIKTLVAGISTVVECVQIVSLVSMGIVINSPSVYGVILVNWLMSSVLSTYEIGRVSLSS